MLRPHSLTITLTLALTIGCTTEEPSAAPDVPPANLNLTQPWVDYVESDWDDGTSAGHSVELPIVEVAGSGKPSFTPPSTLVDETLQDALDDYAAGTIPDQVVEFLAVLRYDEEELSGKLPQAVVDKGWLEGTITTEAQDDAAYAAAMTAWRAAVQNVRNDSYADLAGLSYTVVSEGKTLPFVRLTANLSDVQAIVATDTFSRIGVEGAVQLDIDGNQQRQTAHMATDRTLDFSSGVSYDGSAFDGLLVRLEDHPMFPTRPVFKTAVGFSRIVGYADCNPTCTFSSTYPGGGTDHGNLSLALLVADLTAGQDGAFPGTDTTDQRRRSATAHNATALSLNGAYPEVLDFMIDAYDANPRPQRPQIASKSGDIYYTAAGKSSCVPSVHSHMVDRLADHGIALFVSAGNAGDGDPTTCDMRLLSVSSGSFVVNAHYDNRTSFPSMRSGVKGSTDRDYVDSTTYRNFEHCVVDDGTGNPEYAQRGGTSISTPLLASAATTYQEFYMDKRSALADDPGILYANLLLMGDRYARDGTCSGSALYCDGPNEGFDSTLGSGRFRLRTFSSAASPSDITSGSWKTGRLCVDHGDVLKVPMPAPGTWPTQAYWDAVARWTEPAEGTNDITLRIISELDDVEVVLSEDFTPATSGAVTDVKRRVGSFVSTPIPPGTKFYLEFEGTSVVQDSDSCPGAGQRVHYAAKIEAP